jgi:hypothetical protein
MSGGQTGVDRAALDWAIEHRIAHGGWCPKGRRAEDGVIPKRYQLQETPSRDYQQRTRWNVRDSDATLIISLTKQVTGGTLFTRECADKMRKPCLHIHPSLAWRDLIKAFREANRIRILNTAGPRRSTGSDIELFVHEVLDVFLLYPTTHTATPLARWTSSSPTCR